MSLADKWNELQDNIRKLEQRIADERTKIAKDRATHGGHVFVGDNGFINGLEEALKILNPYGVKEA